MMPALPAVNGLFLLAAACGISLVSRLFKVRGRVEQILGTLTAPCAETCRDCCDPVMFDGSCSCPDGRLRPLPPPPSARAKGRRP